MMHVPLFHNDGISKILPVIFYPYNRSDLEVIDGLELARFY